jgi:hypothetical protein
MRRLLYNGRGTFLVFGMALIVIVVLSAAAFVALGEYKEATEGQVQDIESVLHDQKICGDTSQDHCQALFDRLADNISPRQEERLACTVARLTTAEVIAGVKCGGVSP